MKLNKIIIWGHKLHNHTHSYIHNAFYLAFKHLNFKTYWFDKEGNNNYPKKKYKKIDFNNALYIVHGLESKNLPLNNTSFYICHNVKWKKVDGFLIPIGHTMKNLNKGIPSKNMLILKCLKIHSGDKFLPYKNTKYYFYTPDYKCIVMPWATDLLPEEIDENIKNLKNIKIKNRSNFIGMKIGHWDKYSKICEKYNIKFKQYGGTFNINSDKNKSVKDNIKLIQKSIIAPALQSDWQIRNKYIPCRIFKNISYGKMGMTNSRAVYHFFEKKILYSKIIDKLVKKGLEFNKRNDKFDKIKELMEYVKNNHTYINRINFILEIIKNHHNIIVVPKKSKH